MIVLDSSAALEIAKDTEVGHAFQNLMLPDEEVIAPTLFSIEVANAAWKHVHAGLLDTSDAITLRDDALALPDRLLPVDDLLIEAYEEGVTLDHSIYDMLYLVLARRYAATLFTCDIKLQSCCAKRNVNCAEEITM